MNTPPPSVRWTVVALLTSLSWVSYMERKNISVAAKFMMPALGLNHIQMGLVFSSFMVGYAVFQISAGRLGDHLDPRSVLSAAALSWAGLTLFTGLLPGLLVAGTVGTLVVLVLLRFVLGVSQATTYPVAARALVNWIPASELALSNSFIIGGLSLGSAITPPLAAWLMVHIGWRHSFYVFSAFGFLIAFAWWHQGLDDPRKHPRVNKGEIALINPVHSKPVAPYQRSISWWRLFQNRNLCLISLSYFLTATCSSFSSSGSTRILWRSEASVFCVAGFSLACRLSCPR